MKLSVNRRQLCQVIAATAATTALPAARAQSPKPLELGVLPNISARVLLAQYQPLHDYLHRETQRAVQVSTAPSWTVFHQRTLALEYDVIVTAANLARVAQLDGGYQPLLLYAPAIKGMVIYPSTRPIKSVTELAGQTLALSNPQSLVTLRGMRWLAENGLQRDRDFKTINTRTDDSVGNVVVRGDAVAAMLSGGEFRAIPEATRTQLTALTTFAEVPGFILMASPRMGAEETRALKNHLLAFAGGSDEGKAFFAATGFSGMREPAAGLMESMDAYAEATRRVLATPG